MKEIRRLVIFFCCLFFCISAVLTVGIVRGDLTRHSESQAVLTAPVVSDYRVADTQKQLTSEEMQATEIYKRVSPSVVNITSYKTQYINYFFEIFPETSEGQGSGAIINEQGYIVTNYHVVGNADRLTVALSEGEDVYEAEIVGSDADNDLAIIKIKNPPKNLTVIEQGTSTGLLVGQRVFAIGNPFGLDRTMTSGIISAMGRPIKTDKGTVIDNAIQTDASVNPGNSGGPLLDSSGRMIGINTMIMSPSGGSVGIGFAIPIDKIRDITNEIIKYGYVKKGWIDATFLPMTSRIARSIGTKTDSGLMIMQVAQGGQAYKAGLRGGSERAIYRQQIVYIGGDIIVGIDGIKIATYSDFINVLKDKKPGESVKVKFVRNNREQETTVKLIDKRLFTE